MNAVLDCADAFGLQEPVARAAAPGNTTCIVFDG